MTTSHHSKINLLELSRCLISFKPSHSRPCYEQSIMVDLENREADGPLQGVTPRRQGAVVPRTLSPTLHLIVRNDQGPRAMVCGKQRSCVGVVRDMVVLLLSLWGARASASKRLLSTTVLMWAAAMATAVGSTRVLPANPFQVSALCSLLS